MASADRHQPHAPAGLPPPPREIPGEATELAGDNLGAFYTPAALAGQLVDWAIRSPYDTVLDPGFGGRMFLSLAAQRLRSLGAHEHVGGQLTGVEIDPVAFGEAGSDGSLTGALLIPEDFFLVSPGELPKVTAVIGNPPYIRYQQWNGRAVRAHELSAQAGVPLSRRASSWAPFLVHAVQFLRPGGRLALVVPGEILHADYAAPVIEYLVRRFSTTRLTVAPVARFGSAVQRTVVEV